MKRLENLQSLNRLIIILLLSICYTDSINKNGSTAFNFLEIEIGSSGSAMGGAYVSMVDDASSIYWNPACLTNIRTNSALFMHQEWVLDMSQYYIASSINLNQIGTLGFALNYFDYGREEVTTLDAQDGTNEFYLARDYSLSLAYARRIVEYFSFGTSIKYLSSNIWHMSANAVAIDLGVKIDTKFFSKSDDSKNGMKIGMSISNFGTKVKYDGMDLLRSIDISEDYGNFENVPAQFKLSEWELPLIFRAGISLDVLQSANTGLVLSSDFIHPNNNAESINFGIQFIRKVRGIAEFYIRGGMKSTKEIEIDSISYSLSESKYTYGAGLKYKIQNMNSIKIDYCYKDIGLLGNFNQFTLGLTF